MTSKKFHMQSSGTKAPKKGIHEGSTPTREEVTLSSEGLSWALPPCCVGSLIGKASVCGTGRSGSTPAGTPFYQAENCRTSEVGKDG